METPSTNLTDSASPSQTIVLNPHSIPSASHSSSIRSLVSNLDSYTLQPILNNTQQCERSDTSDAILLPTSSEEWKDRGAAIAYHKDVDSLGRTVVKATKKGVKDFIFGRTLGEGSYSTVVAASDKAYPSREYAIKVLDKRHIIKEKKVKYVNIEKNTLNLLTTHPGIVRLYYTFQDERSLYFALDLASNGELLGVLKEYGTFDLQCTQFYASEILDAVDYMHHQGVIHRDLKPENVLLDRYMHVKITDFGTAKILTSDSNSDSPTTNDRSSSFVGTAEYVSPELLTNKVAGKASDLWAFGCIVFQLLAGRPPFKGPNEYQTFQKIVNLDFRFPEVFPTVAHHLIERLLITDPNTRLSIEQVKQHDIFRNVEWGPALWKRKAPRIRPYVPFSPASTDPQALPTTTPSIPDRIDPASLPSSSSHLPNPTLPSARSQGHAISALPPPSQLDIEWSSVLTQPNERILKLGNMVVTIGPPASRSTPRAHETASRLSRFFATTASKRRNRLVLVTSCGRILLTATGGNDKRLKMEISLLEENLCWKTFLDPKGVTVWCVDIRDKHILFEDPKASSLDSADTRYAAQEWIDSLERSCEFARIQIRAALSQTDGHMDGLSPPLSDHSGPAKGSPVISNHPNTQASSHSHLILPDQPAVKLSRDGPTSLAMSPDHRIVSHSSDELMGAAGSRSSSRSRENWVPTSDTNSSKVPGMLRNLRAIGGAPNKSAGQLSLADDASQIPRSGSRKRFSKRLSRPGLAPMF